MPVSNNIHLTDCIQIITGLQPKSVLDVGCGFGLWGFLCREYLDVWNERVQPGDWQVRIDGIELWEPYIQAHQRALYNNIIIKDVRNAIPDLGEYDLIIAGDVIEHLDKPDAEWVLEELYDRATKALMVNIPLTGDWEHGIVHGNPGELHRSQWTKDDFSAFPAHFTEYNLPCGTYGVFVCTKTLPPAARVPGLHHTAARREKDGDRPGAIRALQRAHALAPTVPDIMVHLVDLLLQSGEINGAIAAIETTLTADPTYHYGRLCLARIHAATGNKAAAAKEAQRLLAAEKLNEETRAGAEGLLG